MKLAGARFCSIKFWLLFLFSSQQLGLKWLAKPPWSQFWGCTSRFNCAGALKRAIRWFCKVWCAAQYYPYRLRVGGSKKLQDETMTQVEKPSQRAMVAVPAGRDDETGWEAGVRSSKAVLNPSLSSGWKKTRKKKIFSFVDWRVKLEP